MARTPGSRATVHNVAGTPNASPSAPPPVASAPPSGAASAKATATGAAAAPQAPTADTPAAPSLCPPMGTGPAPGPGPRWRPRFRRASPSPPRTPEHAGASTPCDPSACASPASDRAAALARAKAILGRLVVTPGMTSVGPVLQASCDTCDADSDRSMVKRAQELTHVMQAHEGIIPAVVHVVHHRACRDPACCPAYARLCHLLHQGLLGTADVSALLDRACEAQFQLRNCAPCSTALLVNPSTVHRANVSLLAHLVFLGMLPHASLQHCMDAMLAAAYVPTPTEVEMICSVVDLCHPGLHCDAAMTAWRARMVQLTHKTTPLPPRYRFMLCDSLEAHIARTTTTTTTTPTVTLHIQPPVPASPASASSPAHRRMPSPASMPWASSDSDADSDDLVNTLFDREPRQLRSSPALPCKAMPGTAKRWPEEEENSAAWTSPSPRRIASATGVAKSALKRSDDCADSESSQSSPGTGGGAPEQKQKKKKRVSFAPLPGSLGAMTRENRLKAEVKTALKELLISHDVEETIFTLLDLNIPASFLPRLVWYLASMSIRRSQVKQDLMRSTLALLCRKHVLGRDAVFAGFCLLLDSLYQFQLDVPQSASIVHTFFTVAIDAQCVSHVDALGVVAGHMKATMDDCARDAMQDVRTLLEQGLQ